MAMQINVGENHHQALGADHCSSYTDQYGKYINGFACPKTGKDQLFCCGTANYKYCCTKKDEIKRPISDLTLVLGVIIGILLVAGLLTTVSCLYCQCCILYKRKMSRVQGGPHYRLQCSNSGMSASASGGVANMYSFSTQNSAATTPLEPSAAVQRTLSREPSQETPSCDHILVDVECEIVPPPHSFRQLSTNFRNSNVPDILEKTPCLANVLGDVSSASTLTSPSLVVGEIPSHKNYTGNHNRNLSTSTGGATHITSGSSETNSALSASYRLSSQSHDSGYSVTSDALNGSTSGTAQSPTRVAIAENLYRSTKF